MEDKITQPSLILEDGKSLNPEAIPVNPEVELIRNLILEDERPEAVKDVLSFIDNSLEAGLIDSEQAASLRALYEARQVRRKWQERNESGVLDDVRLPYKD